MVSAFRIVVYVCVETPSASIVISSVKMGRHEQKKVGMKIKP